MITKIGHLSFSKVGQLSEHSLIEEPDKKDNESISFFGSEIEPFYRRR